MPIRRMPTTVRDAYRAEITSAATASQASDAGCAWHHLERAHILSQPFVAAHVASHGHMLRLAVVSRSPHEAVGQIIRIVAAGPASAVGRIPVGNTGRADVPLRREMPVPTDLAEILTTT